MQSQYRYSPTDNTEGRSRVYIRVARGEDVHALVSEVVAVARARGLRVHAVYVDEEGSDLPGLRHLFADLAGGVVTDVIVRQFDDLCRDACLGLALLFQIRDYGATCISLEMPGATEATIRWQT